MHQATIKENFCMTEYEYQLIQEGLRKKLNKHTQLSNREEGYNNGILCAMSKVREIYKRYGAAPTGGVKQ